METLLPENLCAHRKEAIEELIKSRARKTAAQPQILLGKPTGDHDGLEEVLVELFTSFTKSLSHVLMRSCEDFEVIQIPNQVQSPVGDQRLVDPGESSKRPRPTAKDRRVCSKRRCAHKFDQGCQETKRVQSIQEPPDVYRTTYIGHHTSRSHSLNKPPQNPKSEARSRSFSSKTISTQDSESYQDTSSCPSPVSPVRKECGDGRLQSNSLSRDLQDRKDLKIQDDLVHFRKDFEGGVLAENLDGRIQDALGHFQGDFKGGVSAKALGAKFGGYGTFLPRGAKLGGYAFVPAYSKFLPTCKRSPVRHNPRTPAKVHDSNAPTHMPKQSTPRDADAPNPARRDSSHPATNVLKEAKDLKHQADIHTFSGSSAESTGVYFQAAHKFLHGASLIESTNDESVKQGDMIQSMQVYSSTAKLYEYCAHEYEKSNDMAAAALAYKCAEVAYMRLLYSCRSGANIDCHKLQTALELGESPCWSTSKVDNVNNLSTPDAVPLSKDVSSPQVPGNHVISAQNRPSYSRLLQFTQDVNCALGASWKSQLAFAKANLRKVEAQYTEGITSVKTALDFSFQDMEELLRLVRLAMVAIGL